MMSIEILRALAGIAASEHMDQKIREEAGEAIRKIIKVLEKQVEVESKMMTKASAEMNGIIS